jgi:hypothetical protein
MRREITNKIGTPRIENYLPFHHPEEAGHLPALKEEDKKND